MGIYATGMVRANRKHMSISKPDKQMKCGEDDWLSVIKWVDNRPLILAANKLP